MFSWKYVFSWGLIESANASGCGSRRSQKWSLAQVPLPILFRTLPRPSLRCDFVHRNGDASPAAPLFRPRPYGSSLQIPLSPPNRVAFEPAALLFVYHLFFIGRLQHHQTIAQNNSATHNFQKFFISLLTNRPGCCKLKLGFLAAKIGGVTF